MGKSSRSKKAALAQTGGVAVLEQPSAKVVVDSALKSIATSRKPSTRDKAIEVIQANGTAKAAASAVKLNNRVIAAAVKVTAKVVPVIATQAVAGGMIATSYRRTSGAMKGSYGALLQTPAMKGTLKGRWCRHQHTSAGEAITCAKAMAEAKVTVAA